MKDRIIEDKREMSRQTLKANTQKLCELFLEDNRVAWDGRTITDRNELIERLTTFNDNRRKDRLHIIDRYRNDRNHKQIERNTHYRTNGQVDRTTKTNGRSGRPHI